MTRVVLPNDWIPRPYQLPCWTYFEGGGKRAVEIWHRRSGKDDVALHLAAVKAHERVGTYWHMLPEAAQARKAIWTAIDPHKGKRRVDIAFPSAIRKTTREQEMAIEFKIGSTWQVVGSDNFNSLVGSPPVGVVFSEWALADPRAWAYLRPILAENGGWALFISTPRGRNHAHRMYEAAKTDDAWHAGRLTAHQTGVFEHAVLETERRELIREYGEVIGNALFEQEYLCSFEAPVLGAVYAAELRKADEEERITRVPYDPRYPVYTGWDYGFSDSTVIWFAQIVGREIRIIDYHEGMGAGIDAYMKVLKDKPYTYEAHFGPHDGASGNVGTGKSIAEVASEYGVQFTIVPRMPVSDGVNAVRMMLPRCAFDAQKCERGIDALRSYHYKWDDDRKILSATPVHDWSSHGADGIRTLACGIDENVAPLTARKREHTGEAGWMGA